MKDILAQLVKGKTLSVDQATDAFGHIMSGTATQAQIGALLSMIQLRDPTVDEMIGAAKAMRGKVTPVVAPPGLTLVDTCGTGGDHAGSFNISTAAAIVAAGYGRPRGVAVAKHGNRSVTSGSGSSQALEALGVKLWVTSQTLTRCLDEAGICFCFAPAHHRAMKHAATVRQQLGFRTIFNLLGPLTNPAGAQRQVIGVFDPCLPPKIAQALAQLGCERAMVVHGQQPGGGLDELSTLGPTLVTELNRGQINSYQITPDQVGLAQADPASLQVDSPQASAAMIRSVLRGEAGPARDIVCLNAAAALFVADLAPDLPQALTLATQAVDSGAAAGALDKLVQITQADATPTP